MALNTFVLNDSLDWFLELGRIDPMTRAPFRRGEQVVVCASCNTVHLESTWRDCGGCVAPACNGKQTARRFIKAPPPKALPPRIVVNRIRLTNSRVERRDETPATPSGGDGQPRIVIRNRRDS